jgi:hypothetical protein
MLGFGVFIVARMSKLIPTIPFASRFASIFILRYKQKKDKA